ncbi:unnamed protein product [Protopolystoma xenopodis]|uniref:Uncharacterized protein n=1 Tax=Protopolystoma xenopodis TaxID=117903 RepID=A0A448WXK4_9PLAT|nr:unnamed protein product [Protopolystoma xenopodis]
MSRNLVTELNFRPSEYPIPTVGNSSSTSAVQHRSYIANLRPDHSILRRENVDLGEQVALDSSVPASSFKAEKSTCSSSLQAFVSPHSEQARLRGIIGLMLRLITGSAARLTHPPIFPDNTIYPAPKTNVFTDVSGLFEFWPHLDAALDNLTAGDSDTILLLQPLIEAFCLTHLHFAKEAVSLTKN